MVSQQAVGFQSGEISRHGQSTISPLKLSTGSRIIRISKSYLATDECTVPHKPDRASGGIDSDRDDLGSWEYHATSMTQLHKNSEKAQSTVAFAGSSVAGNNIRRTGKASIAEKVKSKRRKMKSSACGDG